MENNLNSDNQIAHEHSLSAEPLFQVGHLSITNALFTSWLAVAIIVLISFLIRLNLKKVPGKLQHLFEMIIEGALSLCDQVTNNRRLSLRIFPITISIFFFILINNWLGVLPFSSLGMVHDGHFVSFLRSGTADLNTTLALGVFTVIASNVFGVLIIGIYKIFTKYINLGVFSEVYKKVRTEPTILVVAPIKFFVGLIEIVGEFAKVASLSFRLFGNVFAGEVLIASMGALIAYLVPIPFLFLEVLVGFIQALIFAMLTIVYFTIAASNHDEHEENSNPTLLDSQA